MCTHTPVANPVDGVDQYKRVKEPFVQVSKDLANPAHLDPNDEGRSHAVWMRKLFLQAEPEGWYFLLTDVGLAIELCHGACVSWDGREVRHCTSIASPISNKDVLLSYYFGMSAPLKRAYERLRKFEACQAFRRCNKQTYPAFALGMQVSVQVTKQNKKRIREGVIVAKDGESMHIAFETGKNSRQALPYACDDQSIVIAGMF